MKPYYADDWLTVYHGDCREAMAAMEPESVNCVVTSPPYWGLRDYGTATWTGGHEDCDHVERNARNDVSPADLARRAAAYQTGTGSGSDVKPMQFKGVCGRCGAMRQDGQLGLERTPEEYVANLVAVFREVRRVLRKDGTVWLNLGDSYANNGGQTNTWATDLERTKKRTGNADYAERSIPPGLKPKDLVGIPWRVAFALQADGWYLRSDIIWSKPNPMPESVTDRPTKSHEYLFLLAQSGATTCWLHREHGWVFTEPEPDYVWRSLDGRQESRTVRAGWKRVNLWRGRDYYFDAEAVAERVTDSTVVRLSQPTLDQQAGSDRVPGKINGPMKAVGKLTWEERKAAGAAGNIGVSDRYQSAVHGEGLSHDLGSAGTRNIRSVWPISTVPYPGAHFATFPPKLVEPCVKAGCPEGGIVLDPFAGSGTTGMVAQSLSRKAVLVDLSLDYLGQLMTRNADIPLGLGA